MIEGVFCNTCRITGVREDNRVHGKWYVRDNGHHNHER